ncbi:hypothetical protein M2160_004991 [Streptomyces sp. SAI-117]|nr:hypothetical protein [Streptomyces sp. SAI-117]
MAVVDVSEELKSLSSTMESIEAVLDLDKLRADIAVLEEQAAAPSLWDNPDEAQKITSKLSHLQAEVRKADALRGRIDDLSVLFEMAEEEDDPDTRAEAESELAAVRKALDEMEVRTLLSGEYDSREALVNIRAEAGGVDAADFAEKLQRMYLRWAEQKGYKTEVYETSYAEEAGIKSTTFAVQVPYAYGTLSVEQGTHRLVRISPFDNQGRRQTSFAGVEVLPVVEQTDHIEIDESELRVDVYRSSGPGGPGRQHHRLRGPVDPPPHRDRRLLPERTLADPEQGERDERPAGQAAGAAPPGGAGRDGRPQGRRRQLLGQPDAFVRPAPLPDGQGPAHRVRGRQPRGCVQRRDRRLHRSRNSLAQAAGEVTLST